MISMMTANLFSSFCSSAVRGIDGREKQYRATFSHLCGKTNQDGFGLSKWATCRLKPKGLAPKLVPTTA